MQVTTNETAHAGTSAKVKQMLKAILGRGGMIVKEEAWRIGSLLRVPLVEVQRYERRQAIGGGG